MVKNILIDGLELDGGILCLDFANTVSDRDDVPVTDYIKNFGDLLYWATEKVDIISEKECKVIEKKATAEPAMALHFYKEAIELRELVHRIFLQVAKKEHITAAYLREFNEAMKKYLLHLHLAQKGSSFEEVWDWEPGNFYQITAPIIKTAHELLLSDKLARVKECCSEHCGWLFLDTSKNGKRRWCSMDSCGSNDKAIKYYYRKKEAKE